MKSSHKKQLNMAVFLLFFAIMSACFLAGSRIQAHASYAYGMNVRYRTKEEIRNYVRTSGANLYDSITFSRNPFVELPYDQGSLSNSTCQSALAMLNQIRYIAGISSNVAVSDLYNQYAQAASFINYLNGQVSYTPTRPYGVNDSVYQMGVEGASKCNLSAVPSGNRSLNETIVMTWMKDNDSANISNLSHRRWLLNPKMGRTGFGVVSGFKGTFSSIYATDTSNISAPETGVAWPARTMPVEYFSADFPWSISLGHVVNENSIKVTLTRLSDYRTWTFSNTSAEGEFYVDNGPYGQLGCIIFRPAVGTIGSYKNGDAFQVSITGDISPITYNVEFFTLDAVGITYTTAFNSQGGTSVSPVVISGRGTLPHIPVPTKANAEFLGWYTSPNGQGTQLTTSTIISENRTYFAYWRENNNITSLSASYTGNAYVGADVANGLTVYANYSDGHSERVTGYTVSAKTLVEGVNMVTVSYRGVSETVLIVASKKPSGSTNTGNNSSTAEKPLYYNIVFHPNGGTNLSFQSVAIAKGDTLDALPTVERANYSFKGWYTQASGGTRIGRTSMPDSERVLYAQWIRVTKPGKVKTPTLASTQRGQLKVSYKAISGAKGYEISYSTNQGFTNGYTNKKTTAYASKTINDLRPGVTYYVRVRAYKTDSTGKKIYGAYSTKKAIRIKA